MPTGNMPYSAEGECSAGIAIFSRGNHGRPRTKPCKRLAIGDRKSGFSIKIPVDATLPYNQIPSIEISNAKKSNLMNIV